MYSQAGQDIYVYKLIGDGGTYFEIGSGEPIKCNNTYLLENNGWKGVSIEQEEKWVNDFLKIRKNKCIQGDSRKMDIKKILDENFDNKVIDYLSLDVDEATHDTFLNIPFDDYTFKVITVEHDKYSNGDELQKFLRKNLYSLGYELICSDVCFRWNNGGGPFEDWWVHPKHVDVSKLKKYDNCDYQNLT